MTVKVDRARVWMCSPCVYNLRCENEEQQQDVGICSSIGLCVNPRLIPFLASAYLHREVLTEFIGYLLTCNHSSNCSYGG